MNGFLNSIILLAQEHLYKDIYQRRVLHSALGTWQTLGAQGSFVSDAHKILSLYDELPCGPQLSSGHEL